MNRGQILFSRYLFWSLYLFFVCIEFYAFKKYANREIIPYYPQGFDQASYLSMAYETYENIKQLGLINGFRQSQTLVTGLLFPAQMMAFFSVFGATRFSALLVNFTYFIALQIICLLTLKSLTKKNHFLLFFLGLLLLIDTPYLRSGGNLFDIRMDFIAFSLYGIFICLVIRAEFFLKMPWTWITAFLASFLILLRTITVVYIAGALALFFIYLLTKYLTTTARETRASLKERLINMMLFGSIVSMMTFPFIWLNQQGLYNYYMVGHVLGDEKYIRAALSGITNISSLLIYYPRHLLFNHIGLPALGFLFLFLLAYFFIHFHAKKKRPVNVNDAGYFSLGFIFLSATVLVPLVVLTLDLSKSLVVPGIMVVPCLWLVCWYGLYVEANYTITFSFARFINYAAVAVLLMGLSFQWRELHQYKNPEKVQDQQVIRKMYLDIGDYAYANHRSSLQIASDQLTDSLSANGMTALYYETTGRFIGMYVEKLGGTIFRISEKEALTSLKKASVLIVNLTPTGKETPFPFNQSVEKLKPMIRQYAEVHFKQLGDYKFYGAHYRVYVRGQTSS